MAAARFGADTAARLTDVLAPITDPDRLAEIGDWLVRSRYAGAVLQVLDSSVKHRELEHRVGREHFKREEVVDWAVRHPPSVEDVSSKKRRQLPRLLGIVDDTDLHLVGDIAFLGSKKTTTDGCSNTSKTLPLLKRTWRFPHPGGSVASGDGRGHRMKQPAACMAVTTEDERPANGSREVNLE